jgi:hypothetical protein
MSRCRSRISLSVPAQSSGRYTISDGAILFKIEHAMYANWEGTEQKRTFSISGDELKYHVPTASAGGTAEVVWKRVK